MTENLTQARRAAFKALNEAAHDAVRAHIRHMDQDGHTTSNLIDLQTLTGLCTSTDSLVDRL